MNSSYVLSIATFLYGAAAILYWVVWVYRRDTPARIAFWTGLAGVVLNTVGILLRWQESYDLGIGHVPLSDQYESLVFFSWTTMVVYLVIERQYKVRALGAFITSFATLAMAYASFSTKQGYQLISPLLPALQSNWLIAHVVTCFLGYAGFAMAFGLAIIFLIKSSDPESQGPILSRLPEQDILDEILYQNVLFGFLFLSVGIITGAVWANSSWGKYWTWDPKETWSLITWLVYAGLIHTRLVRGWQGKPSSWFAIFGFLCVLFTWFGVNYLSGLHQYGS